ncbi:MAG: T9SS type A sorting domain-containing protein [Bacteroidota bacterium]
MKNLITILALAGIVSFAHAQNHWISLDRPTTRNLNRVVFLDTLNGWVAGDSGTILKTTNGGGSWSSQNTGIYNELVDLFMVNDSVGWALALLFPDTTFRYGTIILNTTNGGTTWTNWLYRDHFFFTIRFIDLLNGWMGGDQGLILRTTNGGADWFPAQVDSSLFSWFPIYNIKFMTRQVGYALGGHQDIAGVVWKTTNGGLRWSAQGVAAEPLRGIHYIDTLKALAVGGDFDFGAGMVTTKDAGRTWEYTYLGFFGDARALAFRTPREGYAPLGFIGMYIVTTDTGRTWSLYYSPDSSAVYDVVFVDSLHGFMVGVEGTLLKYNTGIVGVDEEHAGAPVVSTLYQNYPNPFNPTTTIRYSLPSSVGTLHVTSLRVYDVLGQELATLVNEVKQPGTYTVQWDAGSAASGVYFCRLRVGSFTETRKLILLR